MPDVVAKRLRQLYSLPARRGAADLLVRARIRAVLDESTSGRIRWGFDLVISAVAGIAAYLFTVASRA